MQKPEDQAPAAEPDFVHEFQATWKSFSKHSDSCSECQPLAKHVRRNPQKPPYILIKACCGAGQDLAERWLHACSSLLESKRELRRFRVL